MNISVSIRRLINQPDNNLKAIASITLDDKFVIRFVKLFKKVDSDGFWIGCPGYKGKHGRGFINTSHPITSEFREEIDDAVINAYYEAIRGLEELV